jgi:hypothetical protein
VRREAGPAPPPITGSGAVEISGPTAYGEGTVGPPSPLETKPFNPEPHRERIRGWLALLLVAAFLLLIASLVLGVALQWWDIATAKDLAALALPPLTGLTGTVVGFYYAGSKG